MTGDPPRQAVLGRPLARGLGWTGVGRPATLGLAFVAQVLAANLLLPREFGSYALAVSIFSTTALVAQLGLPSSLLRRTVVALALGNESQARREIRSSILVGLVAAGISGAALASPLGESLLGALFARTTVASVATLIALNAALRVLENLVPEALRAFRDFARSTVYGGLLANALFCLALGALLAFVHRVPLSTVLALSAAASGVALIPALAHVALRTRNLEPGSAGFGNPVEAGMWLATIGGSVIAQLDLWVAGALGGARDAALYAAPFRLALLVGLPLIVVNLVIAPQIAAAYSRGDHRELERTLRVTAGLAVLASLGVTIVFLAGGRFLLGWLFGPFYQDGGVVLGVLALGALGQTWTGSNGNALLMTGHHRVAAVMLTLSCGVTIALDVALFRAMGIEGLAVATAIGIVAQNVVQMLMVRMLIGVRTDADVRGAIREVRRGFGRWRQGVSVADVAESH